MIAFAFSGAQKDLLLIHASVTMKDGKGYLFLGKSGTGKSTHSQLWLKHIPGTELLNDDNPAVRLINDEVIVYGRLGAERHLAIRTSKCRLALS